MSFDYFIEKAEPIFTREFGIDPVIVIKKHTVFVEVRLSSTTARIFMDRKLFEVTPEQEILDLVSHLVGSIKSEYVKRKLEKDTIMN